MNIHQDKIRFLKQFYSTQFDIIAESIGDEDHKSRLKSMCLENLIEKINDLGLSESLVEPDAEERYNTMFVALNKAIVEHEEWVKITSEFRIGADTDSYEILNIIMTIIYEAHDFVMGVTPPVREVTMPVEPTWEMLQAMDRELTGMRGSKEIYAAAIRQVSTPAGWTTTEVLLNSESNPFLDDLPEQRTPRSQS